MTNKDYNELEDRRICQALRGVGIQVNSIWDLVHTSQSYPEAIPLLIEMLQSAKSDAVVEGIVRSLTVKEARGVAAGPLLKLFKDYPTSDPMHQSTKWAIGNVLSEVADNRVFEEIAELVMDKRHGTSRQMLVIALGNMKDSRATPLLVDLLDDEEVVGHALVALGKLKDRGARQTIEKFLSHPNAWVRKEASKALSKIDKAK